MPLIQLVLVLVAVSGLWVINSYIPMQATIKKILNVVVVIVVIVWLLSVFAHRNLRTIRVEGKNAEGRHRPPGSGRVRTCCHRGR
jgi:L-asparagine transporter-like permease